ncbi:hypothetical protein, partial [Serratia marcescens]|uniref:hypothetical protein n=1 Tax=Serratia marcescens TaxID=615 RepID=UPI001953DD29
MMNRQGRPTAAGDTAIQAHPTFTGNYGLEIEEPLLFEIGRTETTGVDLPAPKQVESRLGGLAREGDIG